MDIDIAKVKIKYNDKIKSEFDLYHILLSLNESSEEEIKDFIEVYKNDLVFKFQCFVLYNGNISKDIADILLKYLKKDDLYFNIFNMILENCTIIRELQNNNEELHQQINNLYIEIQNIHKEMEFLSGPGSIFNNEQYIMEIIDKKMRF